MIHMDSTPPFLGLICVSSNYYYGIYPLSFLNNCNATTDDESLYHFKNVVVRSFSILFVAPSNCLSMCFNALS